MKTVWKNIVGMYSIKDVGRNDQCPCGSLMKFKYCCIDKSGIPMLRCTGKKIKKPLADIRI
jgi:hypothetical protein